MNRRQFIKAGAAIIVLPALSKADSVADIFNNLGVDRNSLPGCVRFAEFQELVMREICSALQVPYEIQSVDYQNSNYAKAVLTT